MSQKILILGGLGYVGFELARLYFNSKDKVTVVDSGFDFERVSELAKNKVSYQQRDIYHCDDLIKNADICYNLISITDVPLVLSQESKEKSDLIFKIGTKGNRQVMKNANRLIFLSSHIVFEGIETDKINIDETKVPCPILSYGKSKYQSELDLQEKHNNFLILRLGSTYGFPAKRWKILPNLFAKMTAIEGKIKIFGRDCLKPLIGVYDVARYMKILGEGAYNKEIFHLVHENLTVNQIAQICKECRPNLQIEETQDEAPNAGYSLSNIKLLKLGFGFKMNIKEEIGRMINNLSYNI